jgi:hypothetical protein
MPNLNPRQRNLQTSSLNSVKSAPLGAGYMVQVAAVSKREDADLLKNALQAKSYPVVITSAANDKLFHVQVGHFADIKEAESWKAKADRGRIQPDSQAVRPTRVRERTPPRAGFSLAGGDVKCDHPVWRLTLARPRIHCSQLHR